MFIAKSRHQSEQKRVSNLSETTLRNIIRNYQSKGKDIYKVYISLKKFMEINITSISDITIAPGSSFADNEIEIVF